MFDKRIFGGILLLYRGDAMTSVPEQVGRQLNTTFRKNFRSKVLKKKMFFKILAFFDNICAFVTNNCTVLLFAKNQNKPPVAFHAPPARWPSTVFGQTLGPAPISDK
jgi:hypothetical protein